METDRFILYLKKRGKKSHVIDGLVSHVVHFEKYLKSNSGKSLEKAGNADLQGFLKEMEKTKPGQAKKYCRGIALYYKFCDNKLYLIASNYREAAIEETRADFPLKNFQGIKKEFVKKLAAAGITDAPQMLEAGRTLKDREALAKSTGIPLSAILELVKLSDLSRIGGVKGIRARLYYDAGIDTVSKLARWEPEKLRAFITEYIDSSGFKGIAPTPKEARNTIVDARKLDSVIEY